MLQMRSCHRNKSHRGNQPKRKTSTKNTECPTNFMLTVKRSVPSENRRTRTKDIHLPEFPTIVRLRYQHNHNIQTVDALKFRDVSKETDDKLAELFRKKYGPTAALEAIKFDLQLKHGEDYQRVLADRAVCPDIQYCFRLFKRLYDTNTKSMHDEENVLNGLQELCDEYNARCGNMAVGITDDGQTVAAVCTPLMQRLHRLHRSSGDLCFMDASTNPDRKRCKVFVLLTHSCAGALPLGILITTSESQSTIAAALKIYQTILPSGCFGGERGALGPACVITDDCTSERLALREVFPHSQLLLCTFSILQRTWQWLWRSSSHKIFVADRPNLLGLMRRILLASSAQEAQAFYASSMADPTIHQSFKEYLQSVYAGWSDWACSYRTDLPLWGGATTNHREAAVRVLRDRVLSRTRGFTIAQLADFVTTHLEEFYRRRILAVVNCQFDDVLSSKSQVDPASITKEDITKISETDFKVAEIHSKTEAEYYVNMQVGCCTCQNGRTGGQCKHQAAIAKSYSAPSVDSMPVIDSSDRVLMKRIATGGDDADLGWIAEKQSEVDDDDDNVDDDDDYDVSDLILSSPQSVVQNLLEQAATHDLKAPTHDLKAPPAPNVADVKARFRSEFFNTVMNKLDLSPDVFVPAVEAMLRQSKKLHKDSDLAAALNNFGKNSGAVSMPKQEGSVKQTGVKRFKQDPEH